MTQAEKWAARDRARKQERRERRIEIARRLVAGKEYVPGMKWLALTVLEDEGELARDYEKWARRFRDSA